MAEAWAQHQWPKQSVRSAGICAKHNHPTSVHALHVLSQHHIQWHGTSQLFDANTVGKHDLLLVMTRKHQTLVQAALSACNHRNEALPTVALLGIDQEIEDPYGKGLQDYAACFSQIKIALPSYLEK